MHIFDTMKPINLQQQQQVQEDLLTLPTKNELKLIRESKDWSQAGFVRKTDMTTSETDAIKAAELLTDGYVLISNTRTSELYQATKTAGQYQITRVYF